MTDRELLERAAKAAGLDDAEYTDTPIIGPAIFSNKLWDERGSGYWNPLTDDGDALRLAVKLRLVIQHAPKYVVVLDQDRVIAEHQDVRENGGDPYAATRQAILHAAAEIGRTK